MSFQHRDVDQLKAYRMSDQRKGFSACVILCYCPMSVRRNGLLIRKPSGVHGHSRKMDDDDADNFVVAHR
ncbi:hypothetical protein M569_14530 [Genlisea aurea]|uniref:Uncharacterized protein n=1 Tax=Genlisea aurea TaxID=192259 RepID=S8C0U6_9LAMI|nr:hypothetical protein M569_14530 [Genlisea aurea]